MGPGSAAHHFVLRSVRGTRPIFNDWHKSSPSRLISPEFCLVASPSIERGRREDRVPAGTRGPLCEVAVRKCAQRHTGVARTSGLPCAVVGTAYVALSPGSDALLPPSPCGWLMRRPGRAVHITASLDAQTPGARTTRFCRTRDRTGRVRAAQSLTETAPRLLARRCASRPPPPGPRIVTIAKRPFPWTGTGG